MDRKLFPAALAAIACACSSRDTPPPVVTTFPTQFTVTISSNAPPAVRFAAEDVVAYFGRMGLTATLAASASAQTRCVPGTGAVALLGDGIGSDHDDPTALFDTTKLDGGPNPTGTSLDPGDVRDPISRAAQRFRIVETRCGEGALGLHFSLSGGGLFGRQYAVYELLHALGVRFFHPEQEYVPAAPSWAATPLQRDHTPPFQFRSVSLHLAHPLELGDPLRLGKGEYQGEVKRYIDWQIKNFSTDGIGGVGPNGAGEPGVDLSEYGILRGFPRGTGFNLHETQQGGVPLIDPDSPIPVNEQIAAAIDARLVVADPTKKPRFFGFLFNPSEFTELPDLQIVGEMTFIADYIREHHPEVILSTINHGTYGPPTEHYHVRYYDLPKFAPPNLGVSAHTLMFYDLFRPAPAYGNTSFRFLYDFMVEEYQTRRLWYFPEAAWWLTFDIAVPLYLPITLDARDRDLQAIAFMLQGQLVGHHVFGTGHEWGYWQNEYCSLRMSADLDYRWRDCLRDIVSPMGGAAALVQAVVERAVELQERDIIYGDVLAYLVGTDPETEVAAQVGIVFHPLPPSPAQIARWDLEQLEDWERRIGAALQRMEDDHATLLARLGAVAAQVPSGVPTAIFAEIRDGLEMNMQRARHARLVYGSLVSARLATVRFDPALLEVARARLAAAKAATNDALSVIARREGGYRYQPLARSVAGGPAGDQDENWTTYRFRYLNRTHHGYYYTRIDGLAEEALNGGSDPLRVDDAIVTTDTALAVQVAPDLTAPSVSFGDGTSEQGTSFSHLYAATGVYELTLTAQQAGAPLEVSAPVAVVQSKAKTGFSGTVVEPAGGGIIEAVLPALSVGRIDATSAAVGFAVDAGGAVALGRWVARTTTGDGDAIETVPEELVVPIVNHGSGAILTSLVVEGAKVALAADRQSLTLSGDLATQAIVDALVSTGAFDEPGARAIVASTLGYTPDTLPRTVPMRVQYAVE